MTRRQTRGIAIGELSPAAQDAARNAAQQLALDESAEIVNGIRLGPGSVLARNVNAELEKSRNASRRVRSGDTLQRELARVHAWYLETHRALIRQHYPPTLGAPAVVDRAGRVMKPGTMRYRDGGAPCDFGGIAGVGGKVRGILFDAKVITGTATYAHLEKQYHQLEELRDQQRLKGIGFLLLADQALGIAYLVEDLAPLLAREPITLRDTPRRGATKIAVDDMTHRYPIVRRPPDFSPVAHYARWDWLTTLEELYGQRQHPQAGSPGGADGADGASPARERAAAHDRQGGLLRRLRPGPE